GFTPLNYKVQGLAEPASPAAIAKCAEGSLRGVPIWRNHVSFFEMTTRKFNVDSVVIGGSSLFLIAGPCVIESEPHALKMAEAIAAIIGPLNLPWLFKASYDNANRTSLKIFRGPGVQEGLRILRKVRDQVRVPVLTDVHQASDVAAVAETVDVVQIPAFLCRQTDLLVEAANHARAINIKKGQFVSPWDMRHAV